MVELTEQEAVSLDKIDDWLTDAPDGGLKLCHELVHRIFYDAGCLDEMGETVADSLMETARQAIEHGRKGLQRHRSHTAKTARIMN